MYLNKVTEFNNTCEYSCKHFHVDRDRNQHGLKTMDVNCEVKSKT